MITEKQWAYTDATFELVSKLRELGILSQDADLEAAEYRLADFINAGGLES